MPLENYGGSKPPPYDVGQIQISTAYPAIWIDDVSWR